MALKLESKRRKNADTVLLRFAYTNGKRKYFSTGVVVPASDVKSGVLNKPIRSTNPNSTHFNREVDRVYSRINSIISQLTLEGKVPTGDLVFKLFNQQEEVTVNAKSKDSMITLFDEFLAAKQYDFNSLKLYKTLLVHLKKHFGDVKMTEFDTKKWLEFRDYLELTRNLSPNTVCIRLNKLRSFINFLKKNGYVIPITSFPKPKEEIKQIHLEADDLQVIREFNPVNSSLAQIKDLCLFQCFTGLRISDLFRVEKLHIKTDDEINFWISMKSTKVNKAMVIPLSFEALSILKKYDYKLPKFAGPYYNRKLKELAKLAGLDSEFEWQSIDNDGKKIQKRDYIYNLISSHGCSRTAISYFDQQGYTLDEICRILGKSMGTLIKYYYGKITENSILKKQTRIANKLMALIPT